MGPGQRNRRAENPRDRDNYPRDRERDHRDHRDHRDRGEEKERERRQPYPGEIRPKKDAILNLGDFQGKQMRVKFTGGREVIGILKGYDQLMNLVLDDVKETLRDPENESILLEGKTRDLGMVVVRGPLLQTISPVDGSQVIENPFI